MYVFEEINLFPLGRHFKEYIYHLLKCAIFLFIFLHTKYLISFHIINSLKIMMFLGNLLLCIFQEIEKTVRCWPFWVKIWKNIIFIKWFFNLLFCKASDCFPYGLHMAGRTYVFIRFMFFITSAKALTIFSWPPSVIGLLSGGGAAIVGAGAHAPLCNASRSLFEFDSPKTVNFLNLYLRGFGKK